MSADKSAVRIETGNERRFFKKEKEGSVFYALDNASEIKTETCGCIGRMISEDRILMRNCKHAIQDEPE